MIALDTRCRDILVLLLQSQTPLASEEIASQLGITPRMVRYRLRSIERWLQENSVCLTKTPGCGIFIAAPGRVRKDLIGELERLTGYPLLLSPNERLHMLVLSLLTSDQPLLVKQFERQLNVSRTTVLKDLGTVEEWLEKYDLHLTRRPNFGCKIVGKENDWREAIVDSLLENVGESRLLASYGGVKTVVRSPRRGDIGFERAFRAFLESLEISYSRQLVASVESIMDIRLVDSAYVALMLYIAILIKRVQEKNRIEASPQHLQELKERREFLVAKTVAESIERRFSISLPEPEIACIAIQLLKVETSKPITDLVGTGCNNNKIAPEVLEIVDGLLAKASLYLHPSIRVDQELISNLATRLTLVLDQLRFGLPTRNPLLEDVKKHYPYILKVARESSVTLGDKLGKSMPEEEIGYIAMYLVAAMERLRFPIEARCRRILVVCNAGIATSWLLVSRIRAELPEIEIVDVISVLELQRKKDFSDIDVIVCTIPVEIRDVPTVLVSPFLGNEDVDRLKRVLRAQDALIASERQASLNTAREASLADLITTETIGLGVYANSWQEVVDKAGQLLLYTRAIEARYIEAMKDVIEQYGPYMVAWPGIALLHARPEEGVRRLCMSLVILRQPVNFGHSENDPVYLAIALGAVDNRSHLKALSELHEMLQDKETIDKIRNAVHKSKVVHLISNFSGERRR
jgi:mannitol operon transcriptional antiterminator